MRLLTYNYFINKYIFNNQICKYNNSLPNKHKSFTFNTTDDVKKFIHYYHVKNYDFGDLTLADEITINDGTYNKTWLIAGFNTQLDTDVKNGTFGREHLTLIPKEYLFNNVCMHNKDDNSKGFAGTEMFNIILPEINNNLANILQNHFLPHKIMLSIDNKEKMESFIVKSMLLNYNQVLGNDLPYQYLYRQQYFACNYKYTNNDFDNGDDVFQLPLFKKDVKYRLANSFWWLRNVYSSNCFANIILLGEMYRSLSTNATRQDAIRPFICIG